jgi:cytochrome P450
MSWPTRRGRTEGDDVDPSFDPTVTLPPDEVHDRNDEVRAIDHIPEVMTEVPGRPAVYFVAQHADVCAAARDAAAYRQAGFTLEPQDVPNDHKVLSHLDGELHAAARRGFQQLITPRRMKEYEPVVSACFAEAFDALAANGGGDVITEISQPVPAKIIGILADVEEDVLPNVATYAADYVDSIFRPAPGLGEKVRAFDDHIRDLIASRRADAASGEDWISLLLQTTDEEGKPFSDARLTTMFTKDILVGGSETTTNVMAKLFLTLAEDPELFASLRKDPELIPAAAEEALRVFPPLPVLYRRAADDVELHGTTVPRGATVALGVESANFDPDPFPEPRCFALDRGNAGRRHLTFGHGPHLCVGAPLARLELVTLLQQLVARFSAISVAPGFTPEWIDRMRILQLPHLELVVEPA